ncbi:hypothetical protein D1007_22321 [Hordeum vulgare]|nr:hypothetical protein D1007_22321 [Hordeum vulgare]
MAKRVEAVVEVAFMFLVRGELPLGPLWERFFHGHTGLLSVYVHPDPSYLGSPEKGSVFYGRRVPSKFCELGVGMDEGIAFMWDENFNDKVTNTETDIVNEDDDNSNNDSCSSYDILPSEDFGNNEHGANSGNEDVDVDNVQNSFQESFLDNLSREELYGTSGDHNEADMDIEEAQRQQQMLETHGYDISITWGRIHILQQSRQRVWV